MKIQQAAKGLFCGLGVVLMAACSSSHKVVAQKETVKSVTQHAVCEDDNRLGLNVQWYAATKPEAKDVVGFSLPTSFDAYSADSLVLRTFFTRSTTPYHLTVPLPKPYGCQMLELSSSGVMDPALQAKFPEIVSLQGGATAHGGVDARVDYDGVTMRAKISWDDQVFFITPVSVIGKWIYIVYDKTNTSEIRQPLNERPIPEKSYRNEKRPANNRDNVVPINR
jgi:hypothetical protein